MKHFKSYVFLGVLCVLGGLFAQAFAADEFPTVKPTGFFVTNFLSSSSGVNSFNNQNMTAPTAAASGRGVGRTSFQVGQTRLGLEVKPIKEVTGLVEVDFIDFAKSTPTTTAVPRLRQAVIRADLRDDFTLFAGQTWDIFSPLNPFTYNFVGAQFRAGNAGFIRDHLGFKWKLNSLRIAASVGLPGANGATADTDLEYVRIPLGQASVAYQSDDMQVGVSGLLGRLNFDTVSTTAAKTTQLVYGFNIFGETELIKDWKVRAEAYLGQDLGNINSLTLSQASKANGKLRDYGGYVSSRYTYGNGLGIYGTAGAAKALNASKVVDLGAAGVGLKTNISVDAGLDYKLFKSLKVFGGVTYFRSTYAMTATTEGTADAVMEKIGLHLEI